MEPIKTIAPILFARTRSFWLGIFPLSLTLLDSVFAELTTGGDGGPVVHTISLLTGTEPERVRAVMLAIAPIWGLIVAHQRSGLTRPYTIDPRKEQAVIEAVVDGKSAFDAGKAIGEALKAGKK